MSTNNPAASSAAPTTAELSTIQRDLIKLSLRLSMFYASEQGHIMRENPDHYLSTFQHMGEAVHFLSGCIGLYHAAEHPNQTNQE